eukprot:jgi/Psemu1/41031/gm1.41031_g
MPPAPPFDWNQIQDIAIRFGTFNTKGNAHKHEALNNSFYHALEDTAGLFLTDDADSEGPKTLAPDPVTMLKEIIVNAIMDIIPPKEQTEINKGHISTLFADACLWYVAPDKTPKRIRNKHSMDKAGALAIAQGQETLLIEIRATHWGFKSNWDAVHFDEVYDTKIYSFPEADANDEDATAPTPVPAATGTDMQQLTTLLQQLVNNGNNNNNNAGTNHQATLDLPWNPATLPPPVKERYYRKEEFLTRDDMKDFPITYTDSSGNETIVRQNYYLHNLCSGRNDQRLITRSGDCFDLTRASDKSKEAARDKLFLSGFPQLKDDTHPQVRKWYREHSNIIFTSTLTISTDAKLTTLEDLQLVMVYHMIYLRDMNWQFTNGPDQQPASTLKDTNNRAVSLKEETKEPNQDGRLHRVSRSSNKQGKRHWTIQLKESPRLASNDMSQKIEPQVFCGETDWKEQIAKSICLQEGTDCEEHLPARKKIQRYENTKSRRSKDLKNPKGKREH